LIYTYYFTVSLFPIIFQIVFSGNVESTYASYRFLKPNLSDDDFSCNMYFTCF